MKRWKTILAGLMGVLVGGVATLVALPFARSAIDYFGPPRVTVMNATGGDNMESYGFYRAIVVLTPDRKAKAIYEIKGSNQPSQPIAGKPGSG